MTDYSINNNLLEQNKLNDNLLKKCNELKNRIVPGYSKQT